jgi:hypothetical protein
MEDIQDGFCGILWKQNNSSSIKIEDVMLVDVEWRKIASLSPWGWGNSMANYIFFH